MRALLILISAIVLVDTMLYAALAPILPDYADEFSLSKAEAGLLVGAFGFGALAGALPAGIAATRFGPKATALTGLAVLSLASVSFGFASELWLLMISRFLQGVGSTLSWVGGLVWIVSATPRERRGDLIGRTIAAAVVGALLGPVVGAGASVVGTAVAFSGIALVGATLFAAGLTVAGAEPEPDDLSSIPVGLRDGNFLLALWLTLLPALLFGVLFVLVPLELGAFGWSAVAIGAVFVIASVLEAIVAPFVGRVSDRRGRLVPIRAALVASVAVSLALAGAGSAVSVAALVVVASAAYGALYTPGTALVADAAERVGLSQGLGFGVAQAAWAAGNLAGPAAGGGVAQLAGDEVAYIAIASLCALTLMLASRSFWTRVGIAMSAARRS